MKSFTRVLPLFFVSLVTACASTQEFKLEDQESFNPEKIAGNWVCYMDTTSNKNGNKMVTSSEFQEYFGNDGEYALTGTTNFKINSDDLGSVYMYMEGNWIANQTELMAQGSQAKMLVAPGSTDLLKKIASSANFTQSLKKATKATYDLNDGAWTRTDAKSGDKTECITWEQWQSECEQDATAECGVLLDESMREESRKRFFTGQ